MEVKEIDHIRQGFKRAAVILASRLMSSNEKATTDLHRGYRDGLCALAWMRLHKMRSRKAQGLHISSIHYI